MKRLIALGGMAVALAAGMPAACRAADNERLALETIRGAEIALENGRGDSAWWQRGEQGWELFISGGGTVRRVSRVSVSPAEACVGRLMAWSPDGGMLAFCAPSERGTRLYVARRDGSGLRCLTPAGRSESDPCWSPDGAYLAFLQAGGKAGRTTVWTMRADGSERQKMADDAAVPLNAGAAPVLRWSADGTRITWRAQPLFLGMAKP